MRLLIVLICLLGLNLLTQAQEPGIYNLPSSRLPIESGSMAITGAGRLVIANEYWNTVSIVSPVGRTIDAEIPVGLRPYSVSLSPDTTIGVVANRGDHTLTLFDVQSAEVIQTIPLSGEPFAVVMADENNAYVSLSDTAEIVHINLQSGETMNRIPTAENPAALALWGDFLYVTHLWDGRLSLIYLPTQELVQVLELDPHLSFTPTIAIDRITGIAYLPASFSDTSNPYPTVDSTQIPIINVVDLSNLKVLNDSRIGLSVVDKALSMPYDVGFDRPRQRLYFSHLGTNDLTVYDIREKIALAHVEVGNNPRTILPSPSNIWMYVHNSLDGTVSLIDTFWLNVIDTLPVTNAHADAHWLLGAQLFYSADEPGLSLGHMLQCGNCHFEGLSDGKIWHDALTPTILSYEGDSQWLQGHILQFQKGDAILDPVSWDALLTFLKSPTQPLSK